jgi:uncharacterized protein (DUF488 family)
MSGVAMTPSANLAIPEAINATQATSVYTFGYGNRKSLTPLVDYCKQHGINVLVDVREKPRGWSTIWSKSYLQKQLPLNGIEYQSVPALGNTSGKPTWIPSDTLLAQKELKRLATLTETKTLALMCAELDPARCHRVAVGRKLASMTNKTLKNLA